MGIFGGLNKKDIEFDTALTIAQIGKHLNDFFSSKKMESIDQIEETSGALSQFSGNKNDIAIVATEARSIFSKSVFCVQIYVTDNGDSRHVVMVALGENFLLNRSLKSEVLSMTKGVDIITQIRGNLS